MSISVFRMIDLIIIFYLNAIIARDVGFFKLLLRILVKGKL